MPGKKPNRAKGEFDPKKQARWDFQFAKHVLLQDGHVMPMFIVYTLDGSIPIGWAGGDEYDGDAKAGHRKMASIVCLAYRGVAVSFIGEAWLAVSMPDEDDPEFPKIPPSERSDKKEIIVTQLTWRDNETGEKLGILARAEIVRNESGKVTGVTDEEISEPDTVMGGNITAILPDRDPTPVEQAAAKELLKYLQDKNAFRRLD